MTDKQDNRDNLLDGWKILVSSHPVVCHSKGCRDLATVIGPDSVLCETHYSEREQAAQPDPHTPLGTIQDPQVRINGRLIESPREAMEWAIYLLSAYYPKEEDPYGNT